MLTLQEVKQMVEIPKEGNKVPTEKQLRNTGTAVISRRLDKNTEIRVYRSGYAVYYLDKYKTVFSIHTCGDYFYQSDGNILCIEEAFFNRQEWYLRLILEGEDRVINNREAWEREKNISYSDIPETERLMADNGKSPVEQLIWIENFEEMMILLTERQRLIVRQFFFLQKTQKEIAQELGIAPPVVSRTIKSAVRRIRRRQPEFPQTTNRIQVGKGGVFHAW